MKTFFGLTLLIASLSGTTPALAWGPLGHRIIAETAALALSRQPGAADPTWVSILTRHRFELGFYSTVPDSVFRQTDQADGKKEAPTHFFGGDISKGPNPEIGTAPWRATQFFRRAAALFGSVPEVPSGYISGNQGDTGAKTVAEALFNLGLLAHYVGDASMPYHSIADYNGWESGQGGIHFYLENDCVDVLEPGLSASALDLAERHQKAWLKNWENKDVTQLVLSLFEDSRKAKKKADQVDLQSVVTTPSQMATRIEAKRKPPREGCRYFRELLIERIAKGAVVTAQLWQKALPNSGARFKKGPPLQFSDIWRNLDFIPTNY